MKAKNYSEENILQIKDYIESKTKLIEKSIDWVNSNLKYEDKNNVLLKLKKSQNKLNKINEKIGNKPVMAVFGASQVGKSYLIKNLLSVKGKPFLIRDDQHEYDFLKDINPAGTGAESTGVVTRFTVEQDVKFENFPIKVELLSVKDVLIIILDSFFLDLNKITTFINKRDLEAHIKKLELNKGSDFQNVLNEYDVLEIKEYFENHLTKHTILFEGLSETRFFERIGRIIGGFDFGSWDNIFNVLWNKDEFLSKLFIDLTDNLRKLKYARYGYISFENVLRGRGEILDVKRLKELNSNSEKTVLKTESGDEISVEISYLSALISELIFSIPQELVETKIFLKNSDLLDFPGARSRLGVEMNGIKKNIYEMLLRGKVSYLFNKYSDDYSINNLLFCTNDKQLEVTELSQLLFNWISKNIGNDINERSQSLGDSSFPPLFVIFTFFNNQLKFDTTNDGGYLNHPSVLDYKWETRFVRFFENEIVTKSRNWHMEWSHSLSNFKNSYLLRDFKYSEATFNMNPTTSEEVSYVDKEPNSLQFLEALKQSFLNFHFVKKHFNNPENAWNSAATLNSDGSELIIKNLEYVSNNYSKINHYMELLNSIIDDMNRTLNEYIKTDDVLELRNESMRNIAGLDFRFSKVLSEDLESFNILIEKLSIKPVDIYNLLVKNTFVDTSKEDENNVKPASILMANYPKIKKVNSYEEVLEILKNEMMLPSIEDVKTFLNEEGIEKKSLFTYKETISKSEYYANLVMKYWENNISNLENFEPLINKGLMKNNIEFITTHFSTIFKKREIKKKLIKILDGVISQIDSNQNNEIFLAETFALIINDIVNDFDIHYLTDEEISEIQNVLNNRSDSFFFKKSAVDSESISNLFDNLNLDVKTIALEKYKKWIEFLRISLIVNSGFVDYDTEVNNELIQLVNDYQPFSVN